MQAANTGAAAGTWKSPRAYLPENPVQDDLIAPPAWMRGPGPAEREAEVQRIVSDPAARAAYIARLVEAGARNRIQPAIPGLSKYKLSPGVAALNNLVPMKYLRPARTMAEIEARYPEHATIKVSGKGLSTKISCSFIEPCGGDDCSGVLLERYGYDAQDGRELLCPLHYKRYTQPYIEARRPVVAARSGIPPFYRREFVWPDEAKEVREAATTIEGWLDEDPGRSLYIAGPPGTYKTSLAIRLLERYIEEGEDVLFISVTDLLARVKASFDLPKDDPRRKDDLLSRVERASVLVLDDLGRQRTTDWVGAVIYNIINERQNNLRQTIITSNHEVRSRSSAPESIKPGDSLEDRLGGDMMALAIADRIANVHSYSHIYLSGKSGRLSR